MATVSTKYFYFSKFGGYGGLQAALEQDMVTIPDFADTELIQPGVYTNVTIEEIVSHGNGRYSVDFNLGNTSIFREENMDEESVKKLSPLFHSQTLLSLDLREVTDRYTAGFVMNKYYLINPSGQIEQEFMTANKLLDYVKQDKRLYQSLKGITIHVIRNTQTNTDIQVNQV